MVKEKYIEAGKIINTHGVAGEVKIEVWLDSPAFLKKFKRIFADGKELTVISSRTHKNFLLAKIEGVNDVNAAMSMKGKTVYIDRNDAKLPRGTYFLQDIIGASVIDEQGAEVGKLVEIMETPASRVYVVKGEEEHLIPDVPEFIISVDAESGVIKVRLIGGM